MAVVVDGCSCSSDNIVIKSPNDKRLYRVVHLSNGLCALLIHDPHIFPQSGSSSLLQSSKTLENANVLKEQEEEDGSEEEQQQEDDELNKQKTNTPARTKKAAGALCVGMGSFSDPIEVQGLAHLLEHMLFMGSTEFPDENEYDCYLSKHGGSSNAFTEMEYTCYHFEVNWEFLKGALERFSRFFISPLFKAETMEREVLSVDSEFNQCLQNDACRLEQLQCHTSAPGHPFNRFSWGNKKSLVDDIEKGINLREKILKLYNENYHGGLMKLVVIGGESLDILEDWVLELFSHVKEGPQLKLEALFNAPIWQSSKLYKLEAVKEVHSLNLTWALPCLNNEYLKKPQDYLSHLLQHEGKGSVYFFLKSKGWITSLSAGVAGDGMSRSRVAYIFSMCIHLTDFGLEKVYDVIGIVYQYIKLLQQTSPQHWIFKELQEIGNLVFKFVEEQPQDDYAAKLAANLLLYSEEHIVYGDYAYDMWDEKLITHVLSFLTPENMRVDILSKSFDKQSKDIQYEPWFGSRFSEESISDTLLKVWGDPPESNLFLHLPSKNEFIPKDFSIRNADPSQNQASIHLPHCLIDEPLIKLWYKLDDTFKDCRANTYFSVSLKGGVNNDLRSYLLTDLFATLLRDELNEILYQAGIAQLGTTLEFTGDSLLLMLYGFNDKLTVLLSKVLTMAKSFTPSVDQFKVIKEEMERDLRNANLNPLSHASYLRMQLLFEVFWDVDDQLHCLVDLSYADLEEFIPKLLLQLHIEGLCHGNLSKEEAINIADIIKCNLSTEPLPMNLRHKERVLCLPSGANLVRDVRVKNKLEENSVVEVYFQIEVDTGQEATKLGALADLFEDIVEEPLFDQLRTKEQLGYVVECSVRLTNRVLGFCFCVQSSKYNPVYLHGRIDNFINSVEKLLAELENESFENHRNGLIAQKLEKDPSLSDETSHLWDQILKKRYMFDMHEKEAEALKNISKNDVIDLYNTYFKPTSPKRRRLAVRVWGCNTNMTDEDSNLDHFAVIEDNSIFKKSADFYPSLSE